MFIEVGCRTYMETKTSNIRKAEKQVKANLVERCNSVCNDSEIRTKFAQGLLSTKVGLS